MDFVNLWKLNLPSRKSILKIFLIRMSISAIIKTYIKGIYPISFFIYNTAVDSRLLHRHGWIHFQTFFSLFFRFHYFWYLFLFRNKFFEIIFLQLQIVCFESFESAICKNTKRRHKSLENTYRKKVKSVSTKAFVIAQRLRRKWSKPH